MEILELQKRITKALYRTNNSNSISERRRNYVILSGLVEIYNNITNANIELRKYVNKRIMKHSFNYYLIKELNQNYNNIYKLSNDIVEVYKNVKWYSEPKRVFKNYKSTYLAEIINDFFASLGDKYYKIFKDLYEDKRVFSSNSFGDGFTVFDYEELKSTIFVPNDKSTLICFTVLAHEVGHVINYDITKYSKNPLTVNNYDISTEMFSMFIELIFFDYLKKIKFEQTEIQKVEERFYDDFLIYASQLKFLFSYHGSGIDKANNLVVDDVDEANKYLELLELKDGFTYFMYDANIKDAAYYTYGGVVADIFRYYFEQDNKFIYEIEKHFFDSEAYSSEEILDRLPYVRESLKDMKILKKHLNNIKTTNHYF